MLLAIIGGFLIALFGLILSLKDKATPRRIHYALFFAGIIVLVSGIWGSIEDSKATEELRTKNEEIIELSKINRKLNLKITNWITGGDSYCFIFPMIDEISDRQTLQLFHQGENPIFDVSISIENRNIKLPIKDLYEEITESHAKDSAEGRKKQRDLYMEIHQLLNSRIQDINVGTLSPRTIVPLLRLALPGGEEQELFIKINTRNGYFTQTIRQKKFDGRWKSTWKLLKHEPNGELKMLETFIPPQFEFINNL